MMTGNRRAYPRQRERQESPAALCKACGAFSIRLSPDVRSESAHPREAERGASRLLQRCHRSKQTFRQSTERSVEQRLNYLHDKLLVVYHEQEADSGGNDQDLGDWRLRTACRACWTTLPIRKRPSIPICKRYCIMLSRVPKPSVIKKPAL